MKYTVRVVAIIFAFILECTWGSFLNIQGISPCLAFALIMMISLETEPFEAGLLGLLAGVLTDVLWGRVFGFNALLFMYSAIFISFMSGEFYKKSEFVTSWITLIMTVLVQVISYIFTYTVWGTGNLVYAIFRYAIPTAAYTAAVQLLLYKPLNIIIGIGVERRGGQ